MSKNREKTDVLQKEVKKHFYCSRSTKKHFNKLI